MWNDKQKCTGGLTAKNYIHRLFNGSNFQVQMLLELSLELQEHNIGHENKQPQALIMNYHPFQKKKKRLSNLLITCYRNNTLLSEDLTTEF